MATRKVALVGCVEGPWVNTVDLRKPHLEATMPEGTELEVWISGVEAVVVTRPGVHPLPRGRWGKVFVTRGDPERVLCNFVCGGTG
jgi:hypothetical protein